ncbi:alpha/beta hydrolase [Methylocapsa sp. S129]|uniref:alpha/beta hydrolase n=1 Tax=Methylocapsa sp. S129 TaxID=1641869 RepID=UPI00131D4F3D|nr:alpha/beta hydrolase [Methylocapsa sp. S129]
MNFYRGMDRAGLDAAYNNRAVVPGWEGYLARWADRSGALYAARPCLRDLRYGEGVRQRLDIFPCGQPSRPTILFLHGGYWQWNDKEGQAFIAAGLLAHGLNVAIGEYTLAPAAGMADICAEAIAMTQWLAEKLLTIVSGKSEVWLCGISTGAHLMAYALDLPQVRGGLLISGIYDLEPIRLSSLNDAIGMSAEDARQFSPLHRPVGAPKPLVLAFGDKERPEIQRQSRDFGEVLRAQGWRPGILPVEGADHFSILETLAAGDGVLARSMAELTQ